MYSIDIFLFLSKIKLLIFKTKIQHLKVVLCFICCFLVEQSLNGLLQMVKWM